MKNFNIQKYIDDFKQLPFSIVYSFDNPDGKLDNLHKIIRTIHRTSRTFKKSKIYLPFSSMDERPRYSLTSESKKQIKVRSTFEKDSLERSAWGAYRKTERKYNWSIILQKHFEFKEHETYMESHSSYSKSKKFNLRRKHKW